MKCAYLRLSEFTLSLLLIQESELMPHRAFCLSAPFFLLDSHYSVVLTQDCYESKFFSITGPPALAQLTPTQHFSSRAALNELNLLFVIQLDGKKF